MKNLVIVVHPNIENSRINQAWLKAIRQHPESITVHELYRVYPDGKISDIIGEQTLVEAHGDIIFQFPMYWFSSPSLLKQWFDDVLTHGWAYGSKGKKLKDKRLGLAISMGDGKENYTDLITLDEILSPFKATANYIGMKMRPPFTIFNGNRLSDADLEESAKLYPDYIRCLS
jgi:putative NADPH-quinone reductase